MKLQEVFASEQNKVGTWVEIGYKDPAGGTGSTSGETTNFKYIQGSTTGTDDWSAFAKVGMNDCQTNTKWMIGSAYASATGNVTAKADFVAQGNQCTIAGLTPNFCKIGNTTNGSGCN